MVKRADASLKFGHGNAAVMERDVPFEIFRNDALCVFDKVLRCINGMQLERVAAPKILMHIISMQRTINVERMRQDSSRFPTTKLQNSGYPPF